MAAAATAYASTSGRGGNAEARLRSVATAVRGRSSGKLQLARQPYCAACGATEDLTVDHIVPLARGGRGELSNLQTLCRMCNGSKAASWEGLAENGGEHD